MGGWYVEGDARMDGFPYQQSLRFDTIDLKRCSRHLSTLSYVLDSLLVDSRRLN